MTIASGDKLTFVVTGSVDHAAGTPTLTPDGGGMNGTASYNGIAGLLAPLNSLIGVFLDDTLPTSSAAPAALDFGGSGLTTGFTTLSPGLKQPFFIGDGRTGTGTGSAQTFVVPAGATRLYLGTDDGSGWYNNTGSFSVSVGAQMSATLGFEGRLRDRVSRSSAGVMPDGESDGVFALTLPAGALGKTIRSIDLKGPNGNEWDTISNTGPHPNALWVVGVARGLDAALENWGDGTLDSDGGTSGVAVGNSGAFKLFVSDSVPTSFTNGEEFSLVFEFSDGSAAVASTAIDLVQADLELIGLEVTQSVQDLMNSVPLVENKRTFVRAHIKNLGPGSPRVVADLVGTRIATGGSRIPLGTLSPGNTGVSIMAKSKPSRKQLEDSFYFELPLAWRAGTVELEFRGINSALTCSEPDGAPNCKALVTFLPAGDLNLKFIMLTYNDATGAAHTPSLAEVSQAASEFLGLYPISGSSFDLGTATTALNPCVGVTAFPGLRKELNGLRTIECRNGGCDDYYQGLLADQSSPNCSPPDRINGQGDLPGNASAVFVTTDDAIPRVHEQGHVLGLKHVNVLGTEACGDAAGNAVACTKLEGDGTLSLATTRYGSDTAYGFDVNEVSAFRVYPAATGDFMSYDRPRWTSRMNYGKLFDMFKLGGAGATAVAGGKTKALLAPTPTVLVDGFVALDGSAGQISAVYVFDTPGAVALPQPGPFAIRLENGAGAEVATHSFAPIAGSDNPTPGLVSVELPWNPAIRRIVLLYNGNVLATREASAHAPDVTVTFPNGGESLSGPNTTFTWSGSDLDGDALTYMVEYSADNGATWKALAINVAATSLPVDLALLPGGSQALLRVSASDGLNTAQDQSNSAFTVPSHAPAAFISSPRTGRLFVADQTIVLEGMALDIEEGFLNGSNLAWSSDLDGPLGTGRSLAVNAANLQEGTHVITLAATDGSMSVGVATASIHVLRTRPALPAALSVGPAGVSFVAPPGSGITAARDVSIGNGGDGELLWTASTNQAWVHLSSASGTAPFELAISADPASLAAGEYQGQVIIAATGAAESPQVVAVHLTVANARTPAIDIDGNLSSDALTDGLVILRYLFGVTGPALTNGAIGDNPAYSDPTAVLARLAYVRPLLDVDGDDQADALTDGLLILRYLFGLRGAALVNGAIGVGATRTAAQIESYIQALMQ